MCVARITRNRKFAISLQYLKREVNGEVDFLHPGKHEKLLQIDTMILMDMVNHFQISQNSKFTMSVQYLRKEDSDDVDFLHADKYQSGQHFGHQSWLKGDTMIIDRHDEAFSNYSK